MDTNEPPAKQQVVTIALNGAVATLRRKKGSGFDPRDLGGELDVTRVSLVEYDKTREGYTVNFLKGIAEGRQLSAELITELFGHDKEGLTKGMEFIQTHKATFTYIDGDGGVLVFQEYEEGVAAEVAYLEATGLAKL